MDHARTCEVEEPGGVEEAAAPFPVALHGVDEARQHDGEDEERPELHALGDGARDDRHRGGDEYDLEEEIRQVRVIGIAAAGDDVGRGVVARGEQAAAERRQALEDAAGKVARVHDRVTAQHVHDAGDRIEADVLGQNFSRVLGAHESGFEHRKARRHPHDECAHDEKVKCVQRISEFRHLRRYLCCFHDSSSVSLNGFGAGFAGANANGLDQVGDEDLPVADLAGTCRVGDRLDNLLCNAVVDREFDLGLGQEIDNVLGATVKLRVAALSTKTLDLGDGDALDADVGYRLTDIVELERLDNRRNHFHC